MTTAIQKRQFEDLALQVVTLALLPWSIYVNSLAETLRLIGGR